MADETKDVPSTCLIRTTISCIEIPTYFNQAHTRNLFLGKRIHFLKFYNYKKIYEVFFFNYNKLL